MLGLPSGCYLLYTAPVRPPPGALFSRYRVPVTTDFEATPAKPPKTGRARSVYLAIPLFWRWDFAFDSASIQKAAAEGEITEIHYVEHEYLQVVGLFATVETIVYGE